MFSIPVAVLFLFYHRTGSGIGTAHCAAGSGIGTAHCAAELRGKGVQESGGTCFRSKLRWFAVRNVCGWRKPNGKGGISKRCLRRPPFLLGCHPRHLQKTVLFDGTSKRIIDSEYIISFSLYRLSCLSFCWARCASARGRTTGRGKSSLSLRSPLSLRFSPCALPRSLPSPLYALQSFRIQYTVFLLFYHRTGSGFASAGSKPRGADLLTRYDKK